MQKNITITNAATGEAKTLLATCYNIEENIFGVTMNLTDEVLNEYLNAGLIKISERSATLMAEMSQMAEKQHLGPQLAEWLLAVEETPDLAIPRKFKGELRKNMKWINECMKCRTDPAAALVVQLVKTSDAYVLTMSIFEASNEIFSEVVEPVFEVETLAVETAAASAAETLVEITTTTAEQVVHETTDPITVSGLSVDSDEPGILLHLVTDRWATNPAVMANAAAAWFNRRWSF